MCKCVLALHIYTGEAQLINLRGYEAVQGNMKKYKAELGSMRKHEAV